MHSTIVSQTRFIAVRGQIFQHAFLRPVRSREGECVCVWAVKVFLGIYFEYI